jgi:hypothetical protein
VSWVFRRGAVVADAGRGGPVSRRGRSGVAGERPACGKGPFEHAWKILRALPTYTPVAQRCRDLPGVRNDPHTLADLLRVDDLLIEGARHSGRVGDVAYQLELYSFMFVTARARHRSWSPCR